MTEPTDWPTALAEARRERDEARAERDAAIASLKRGFLSGLSFVDDGQPVSGMGAFGEVVFRARQGLMSAEVRSRLSPVIGAWMVEMLEDFGGQNQVSFHVEEQGKRPVEVLIRWQDAQTPEQLRREAVEASARYQAERDEARRERDEARKHVQRLQDRVDDLSTQASDAVAIVAHTILSHSDLDAIPTGDLHGVDPKGIERVRASMVEAGHLPARRGHTDDR